MRYLEVRRHTMRVQPGDHLSQPGVTLARRLGEHMGPFAYVVTSTIPRAFETAIAMGFAVDEQLQGLAMLGPSVEEETGGWNAGFAAYAKAYKLGRATTDYADRLASLWQRIVRRIPDGTAALAISHGGIIEAGSVACLPEADYRAWGSYCNYCEGVRLTWDSERFISAEVIRVK